METATPTATMTNTQLVQQCFGHFQTGNIPALLDELSDDVEWVSPAPKSVIPWAGTRRGKQSVGEFFQKLDENIDMEKFEPKEFISQGNKVIVLGSEKMRSKETGLHMEGDWAFAFTIDNGKIKRFQEYIDTYETAAMFKK